MRQAFLGHGAYFSEFAIYSHWWFAKSEESREGHATNKTYTLILAQVFTGRSKDYGKSWAPDLVVEPPGYHSVCGTESDMQVVPVVRAPPSPGPKIAFAPTLLLAANLL